MLVYFYTKTFSRIILLISENGTRGWKVDHFSWHVLRHCGFRHDPLQIGWQHQFEFQMASHRQPFFLFLRGSFCGRLHFGSLPRRTRSHGSRLGRDWKAIQHQNWLPSGWICHLLWILFGTYHWTNRFGVQRTYVSYWQSQFEVSSSVLAKYDPYVFLFGEFVYFGPFSEKFRLFSFWWICLFLDFSRKNSEISVFWWICLFLDFSRKNS